MTYSPITSVFNATGYKVSTKIACTLQGSIYKGTAMHTYILYSSV